jgi:hypothetical protein
VVQRSRIVRNGAWANRLPREHAVCGQIREAGLSEFNLSTGRDHQQWVDHATVVNAAEAAVEAGIRVLVTIETETEDSRCLATFRSDPRVARLAENALFGLQSHYWMPFHRDAPSRRQVADVDQLRKGCSQVFDNVVVTPRDEVAACCGLTFEHIPEMRLGTCDGHNLADTWRTQEEDFLKHWIKVDGPYSIVERLLGERAAAKLDGVVHQCQACALLHLDPDVRAELARRYLDFVPDVMTRRAIDTALRTTTLERERS